MPQSNPKLSKLSQPVEPQFLTLMERTVIDSFSYGRSKYGVELHSFNGRSELQDFAEEWVSAGRYVTQLAMRTHKLEELLIRALAVIESGPAGDAIRNQPLMAEIREAVKQACGERND